MNKYNFQKNGFSIIELIIAGAISVTAISVGFSLLQIALKGNKIDETQMGKLFKVMALYSGSLFDIPGFN